MRSKNIFLSTPHREAQNPILIWGSCVSRDVFSYLPKDKFTLLNYTARQSICSASSICTDPVLKKLKLEHRFQQRTYNSDILGNAITTIKSFREREPQSSLIIDFTDERGGLFVSNSNEVITNTYEAATAGLHKILSQDWKHIKFGSLNYMIRFSESLLSLKEELQSIKIWDRTFVIANDWAEFTANGEKILGGFEYQSVSSINNIYHELYSMLEETGWNVLRFTGDSLLADENHKWGKAPFHYSNEFYLNLSNTLIKHLSTC